MAKDNKDIKKRGRQEGAMSAKEFEEKIYYLFGGFGSITKFSQITGITNGTLSRYCNDKLPVPLYLKSLINSLIIMKQSGINITDIAELNPEIKHRSSLITN